MRRACLVGLLSQERTAVWRELEIATVVMEASAGRGVPIPPAHIDIRGRMKSCITVAEGAVGPRRKAIAGSYWPFAENFGRGCLEAPTKKQSWSL